MQLGVIRNGDPLASVQFLDVKPGHDLPDLLLQAAKALGMRSVKKFYTQQGGEIEELREILPGDILYVSAGESFILPPRESEYTASNNTENYRTFEPFHFHPPQAATPAAKDKNDHQKKREEYQQVVLSLSETFPNEPMNMLVAATKLAKGNAENAAALLLERPVNKNLLKEKQALDSKVADSSSLHSSPAKPAASPVWNPYASPSPSATLQQPSAAPSPVQSAVGTLPFAMPFSGETPKSAPVATSSAAAAPSLLSSALGPLPVTSAPSAKPPLSQFEFSAQLRELQSKFDLQGDNLKRAQQYLINYRGDLGPVIAKLTELNIAAVSSPEENALPSQLPPPIKPTTPSVSSPTPVAGPTLSVRISSLSSSATPEKQSLH